MNWRWFVAIRHFSGRRRERRFSPSLLSVCGIAVGVTALVSVMSVMNGFQLGFIEDILEIESYHIRISPAALASGGKVPQEELLERIAGLPGIECVVPFIEIQTLCRGDFSRLRPVMVRCIDTSAAAMDAGFLLRLGISAPGFRDLPLGAVVLGEDLAAALGVAVGESISVLSLAKGPGLSLNPSATQLIVTENFRTETYEFNSSFAFVSMETGAVMASGGEDTVWGIKLLDKDRDIRTMDDIVTLCLQAGYPEEEALAACSSWRDFNRSFFGALRTEKITMMLLIGLIFVVVGVNIFHALRREVRERREEIGVLRSLGASPRQVRYVFALSGVLTGFSGALAGTFLGLLISIHINTIMTWTERAVNGFLRSVERVLLALPGGEGGISRSASFFYSLEVPVRILLPETVAIFLFAFASSVVAAIIASRQVSTIKPAEVLRYE